MRESAWSINGLTLGLLKYCSERGWEHLAEWGREQQAELWLERMWKQIEKIEHLISTSFRAIETLDTLEDIKYANADHLKVFEVDGSTYSTGHEAALAFAEYAVNGLSHIECDGDNRERCGCVVAVAEGLQKSVPDLFAEIEMECIRSLRYYDEREALLADQMPDTALAGDTDAPVTEDHQAGESGKITAKDGRTPEERNEAVIEFLKQHGDRNKKITNKEVAEAIGESSSSVGRTPAMKAYNKKWKKDYGRSRTRAGKGRRPKVVDSADLALMTAAERDYQRFVELGAEGDDNRVRDHERI